MCNMIVINCYVPTNAHEMYKMLQIIYILNLLLHVSANVRHLQGDDSTSRWRPLAETYTYLLHGAESFLRS
jgi:hypothetical protein